MWPWPQAYAGMGNWSEAVTYADQVPTDFVFSAAYSVNSVREENVIFQETHRRAEMSVFGTFTVTLGPDGDPRAP